MRKYDEDDLKELNAEEWMIDIVKLNEHYVWWGCYEDYMSDKKNGWRSASILETFDEMWGLDELNECVNYYFEIIRDNIECNECDGSGYNKETKIISDNFYDFAETGNNWNDKITQDEVEELVKHGRLTDFVGFNLRYDKKDKKWYKWDGDKNIEINKPKIPLAEDINNANKKWSLHDAINRWILIETRAKRLGVWGYCDKCNGSGRNYITDEARLALQLWILHPRKGCSKGVYIKKIDKSDLPKVKEFLILAKSRNDNRFKNIEKIC